MHPLGINAENKNLPVHFMNHSDQEVVIHKHSYVVAMENDQEWNHNIYLSGTSSEPVNQCTLSECLGKSDLLPKQNQQLYNAPSENSGILLVKHHNDHGNAKSIKQRAY